MLLNCNRRNSPPIERLCDFLVNWKLSLTDDVWLCVTLELASVSDPKLVNVSVGGPKLTGFRDVPVMPSWPATSVPYAKNGSVMALLRLKFQRRLLVDLAPKLCDHPRPTLFPPPPRSSRKPNTCCDRRSELCQAKFPFKRSLRVKVRLTCAMKLSLLLGIELST